MTVDDNSTRRLPPIPRLMRIILLSFLQLAFSAIALAADGQVPAPDGCSPPIVADTTGGSGVYPNGDAADVYRTVLDLFFVDGDESPSIIVMHDRAENPSDQNQYCGPDCNPWMHRSTIDTATIVAFRQRSPERPRIIPFGYRIPIVFMSYDDRARMGAKGCAHPEKPTLTRPAGIDPFLSEFTRTYPDAWGTLLLTKVGFNPSHNEALVEARFNCGETCFSMEIIFLRSIDRRWVAVERIPIYGDVPGMWFRRLRYRGPAGGKSAESELLAPSAQAGATAVRREANDAAVVYRTVLDSLYDFHGESPRRIVVTDWFYPDASDLPARPGIDPSTLERYGFLRTVHARPREHLQLRAPISLLPRDSSPALERLGDPLAKKAEQEGGGMEESSPFWLEFRRRYPGAWGTVAFSPAAFNAEHTQALVFTNHACGQGCYNADTWFLERTGESWRISERIPRAKETVWGLDSLRYLGIDASPRAYLRRRVQGKFVIAATGIALPNLAVVVNRNLRSGSFTTDSAGRYSVDDVPINGGIQLKVPCPGESRRDTLVMAPVLTHPGLDTTVNVRVDFRRCLRQKRAHPLVVGTVSPQASTSTYPSPEVAAVYRGVLDALYPRGASSGPILLQPFTFRACDHCVDAELPRLIKQGMIDPSTAQNFEKLPTESVWFRPKFEYSREVLILSLAEQKFLVEQAQDVGGYDKKDVSLTGLVKDAYPGADAIWSLSRVAFNDARTEALVQVGTRSDYWLSGETMLLRKSNGGWRVVRRHIEREETSGERVGDRCEPTDAPSGRPSLGQLERFVGDAHISSVGTSPQLRGGSGTMHLRLIATDTLHRFYWLPFFSGDKRKPFRLKNQQVLASVQVIDDSTGKARMGIAGSLEQKGNTATITFMEHKEGYIIFDGWFQQYKIMKVNGREFFGSWFTQSGTAIPLKGYFCGRLR